jgi:hypothetical protein
MERYCGYVGLALTRCVSLTRGITSVRTFWSKVKSREIVGCIRFLGGIRVCVGIVLGSILIKETSGTGHVGPDRCEDAPYVRMSEGYLNLLCGIDGRCGEGDACVWKTVRRCRWPTRILQSKRVPFSTDGGVGRIACVLDSARLSLVLFPLSGSRQRSGIPGGGTLASKKERMRRASQKKEQNERSFKYLRCFCCSRAQFPQCFR